YRIEDDVEDLANLLERLDHFPTHVVGLSLGGTIAVRLAALRPDLFRGLVVHEPPIYALLGEGSAEYRDFRARAEGVVARWTAGDRPGAAHEFVRSL
ncbi:MAG: alpha/beta hydrolase, partial [Thermoplasmata archaeon]|nr:alpha/beta hydrolase [Thermoplasmata archaeon]